MGHDTQVELTELLKLIGIEWGGPNRRNNESLSDLPTALRRDEHGVPA